MVGLRKMLGVPNSNFQPPRSDQLDIATGLVEALVTDTFLAPLAPEIFAAVGFPHSRIRESPLDALLLNARHLPEPLLETLASSLLNNDKQVAVVNPVGHYNDKETRIVGPNLLRRVDHLVLVASTQSQRGGSFEVLSKVLRLLRNPHFTPHIGMVDVVIPMFGGSRGHRLGQDSTVGFEILEAVGNPKLLTLPLKDIYSQLRRELVVDRLTHFKFSQALTFLLGLNLPTVRFITVDIHNAQDPTQEFKDSGFEFVSVDSGPSLAQAAVGEIATRGLNDARLLVVACDGGAITRTECIAEDMLRVDPNRQFIDVVYIDKTRAEAGVVDKACLACVIRFSKDGWGRIERRELAREEYSMDESCVLVFSDDMIDTGGTARTDVSLVGSIFSNHALTLFLATHAVLSKGASALNRIGADVYVLTNSLKPDGLLDHPDVRIVDMAPAIAEAIFKPKDSWW